MTTPDSNDPTPPAQQPDNAPAAPPPGGWTPPNDRLYPDGAGTLSMTPPPRKKRHRLRTTLLAVVALVVAISVISAIAGGSKTKDKVATTTTTTAAPTSAATTPPTTTDAPTTAAPTTKATTAAPTHKPDLRAGLGDTVRLTDDKGYKFDVTLVKVDAHARALDGYSKPDAGNRYYAAQFRIKAVTGTYDDAPDNGAKAIDSDGQAFETDFVERLSSGHMLSSTTVITKGDSALGWLVFQVAKTSKIVKVQFGLDSGFSETGEWFTHKVDHS